MSSFIVLGLLGTLLDLTDSLNHLPQSMSATFDTVVRRMEALLEGIQRETNNAVTQNNDNIKHIIELSNQMKKAMPILPKRRHM